MTQGRAKEMLPFIQALAEGKTIQVNDECIGWVDCKDPSFCMRAEYYRVKPEESEIKIRPYEDCKELIDDYNEDSGYNKNTVPSIWIKHKTDGRAILIVEYGKDFVKCGSKSKPISLDLLLRNYSFLNDSPCGVEVKE